MSFCFKFIDSFKPNPIMKKSNLLTPVIVLFILLIGMHACQPTRQTKPIENDVTTIMKVYNEAGDYFNVSLKPGKHHNYPTFAIWMEDMEANPIQTVFVTQSIASGYYRYGDAGDGKWLKVPGEAIRPAALPYWLHRKESFDGTVAHMPTTNKPFPDAYTGATPPGKAFIKVFPEENMPQKFRLLLEVNQPWDWNDYWTNNKYPGNANYRTSAQPSLVYAVTIDRNDNQNTYHLNPIGHGHYDGSDGMLYTDLTTINTALEIFENIIVEFR
jgi:hypothetical protein